MKVEMVITDEELEAELDPSALVAKRAKDLAVRLVEENYPVISGHIEAGGFADLRISVEVALRGIE